MKGRSATPKDFGAPYLRTWRQHAGLSLDQAAEKAGAADKSWLSKRENRRVPITVDDLDKLARIYHCDDTSQLFHKPSENIKDRLGNGDYPSVSEAVEDASSRESLKLPKNHIELTTLVLSLPPEAVPAVGLFIKRLLAAKKEDDSARPLKGETGA